MEFHGEPQPIVQLAWFTTDHGAQHPEPFIQEDHGRGIGHLEPWVGWMPHDRPAVEGTPTGAGFPDRRRLVALRTDGECAEAAVATRSALLIEQAMLATSFPVSLTAKGRSRCRDTQRVGKEETHGRSGPSRSTSQNSAPEPPFEQRATSAPAT
jgi:hypothetical protein